MTPHNEEGTLGAAMAWQLAFLAAVVAEPHERRSSRPCAAESQCHIAAEPRAHLQVAPFPNSTPKTPLCYIAAVKAAFAAH